MWGASSPGAIAARFAKLIEDLGGDAAAAKARGQQLALLRSVGELGPATLNQIAASVDRGAPAVSRAIDALVRADMVSRQPDPDNRRRLQLTLTDQGREALSRPATGDRGLESRLAKIASSELRALERGIEILERLPQ
jgi:DNA-binding MarR family transcriptional regulator